MNEAIFLRAGMPVSKWVVQVGAFQVFNRDHPVLRGVPGLAGCGGS